MDIVKLTTIDGQPIEYVNEIIGSGAMKDVYMSPDRSYVVAFFKNKPDVNTRERMIKLTGIYRDKIFQQEGGHYWQDKFCWPNAMVEHGGKLGIVCPTYPKHFFFEHGSIKNDMCQIKGREKEGKWVTSARVRTLLDPQEKGDWRKHMRICTMLSRSIRRMHAAGLAHSDLSYKNVLVDPCSGSAVVIDIDGLVVPGLFTPDVVGTPDFIAPEVKATLHLSLQDSNRKLPSRATDQHALAVLNYMYLLYRHPLRGGKIHDPNDEIRDEELSMGSKALFIEHAQDTSNRPHLSDMKSTDLPWGDVGQIPYTVTGPYLKPLFEKAFIDGLHQPAMRPTADEWEQAFVKTNDLLQPCRNPDCEQKWFVFDNSLNPCCSFCKTPFKGQLPILNLYSARKPGTFRPDNHRLMVYDGQYIYEWHVNSQIFANEKLTEAQKKPVAYFRWHQNSWWLANQRLTDLWDKTENKPIPPNTALELKDGQNILLSGVEGGRLAIVQMVSV